MEYEGCKRALNSMIKKIPIHCLTTDCHTTITAKMSTSRWPKSYQKKPKKKVLCCNMWAECWHPKGEVAVLVTSHYWQTLLKCFCRIKLSWVAKEIKTPKSHSYVSDMMNDVILCKGKKQIYLKKQAKCIASTPNPSKQDVIEKWLVHKQKWKNFWLGKLGVMLIMVSNTSQFLLMPQQ